MDKNNSNHSRRNFLKHSLTGIACAVAIPSIQNSKGKNNQTKKKIIHRTLGKTGLKIPIISMGAFNATNLVRSAIDSGIVHIDTSSDYSNGNHERMLGEVFKEIPRDSFIIATSYPMWRLFDKKDAQFDKIRQDVTTKMITETFEGSLKRLGLDHVDIYYLAGINKSDAVLYEPYINTFKKFKEEGKTRFIGVTTHSHEPEVIKAVIDSKAWDVVLTAYNFRQPHYKQVKKAIADATKAGLGIVAMKTQAGVYWDKQRKSKINMKAALKWVLQDENVHTAIPGFSSYEEMNEDLSIMEDLNLTSKEKEDLKLGDESSMSGLYCQQCETCLTQCEKSVDIPVMMRSYMYAYGYKNPAKAKDALQYINNSKIPCLNCNNCTVQCSMGFDVQNRLLDIARIIDIPVEFLV